MQKNTLNLNTPRYGLVDIKFKIIQLAAYYRSIKNPMDSPNVNWIEAEKESKVKDNA